MLLNTILTVLKIIQTVEYIIKKITDFYQWYKNEKDKLKWYYESNIVKRSVYIALPLCCFIVFTITTLLFLITSYLTKFSFYFLTIRTFGLLIITAGCFYFPYKMYVDYSRDKRKYFGLNKPLHDRVIKNVL